MKIVCFMAISFIHSFKHVQHGLFDYFDILSFCCLFIFQFVVVVVAVVFSIFNLSMLGKCEAAQLNSNFIAQAWLFITTYLFRFHIYIQYMFSYPTCRQFLIPIPIRTRIGIRNQIHIQIQLSQFVNGKLSRATTTATTTTAATTTTTSS